MNTLLKITLYLLCCLPSSNVLGAQQAAAVQAVAAVNARELKEVKAKKAISQAQRIATDYIITQATGFPAELQAIIRHYALNPLDFVAALYTVKRLMGHESVIFSITISPHDGSIITGSYDKKCRLWDKDGNFKRFLPAQNKSVLSVAAAPHGTLIIGSDDKATHIISAHGKTILDHDDTINAVAIDHDIAVTGCSNHKAYVWSHGGVCLNTLRGHTDSILAVAVKNNTLATGSADTTIRVWDRAGALQSTLKKHDGAILFIAITKNGDIISSAADKCIILWHQHSKYATQQRLADHAGRVPVISLSPDNLTLIAGSNDESGNTIEMIQLSDRSVKTVLRGHVDDIRTAAIGNDGTIVTASEDSSVILRKPEQHLMTLLTQQFTLCEQQEVAAILKVLEYQKEEGDPDSIGIIPYAHELLWSLMPEHIKAAIINHFDFTTIKVEESPLCKRDHKTMD